VLRGIRLVLSVRGLEELSQERHRQAVTDELTGLRNRRYLFKVLDTFFTGYHEHSEESLAFLFVDLDRFKEINDSFGHPAGDELLRQLGERLEGSLREDDLLVRLGGDEFAVVLSGGDVDYAMSVAERLTQDLHQPFLLNSVNASIGASIGLPSLQPMPPIVPGSSGVPMWPCIGQSLEGCRSQGLSRTWMKARPHALGRRTP